MSREELFIQVRECVAKVVGREPGEIQQQSRIIDDLGADSLDLLDLIFQLEQKFKIRISPGDIERRTRKILGETPLEIDGVYTPQALAELRRAMPEVPAAEMAEGLTVADLPRRFRVETFMNLVERLREEQHAQQTA